MWSLMAELSQGKLLRSLHLEVNNQGLCDQQVQAVCSLRNLRLENIVFQFDNNWISDTGTVLMRKKGPWHCQTRPLLSELPTPPPGGRGQGAGGWV